jgi:hypothetical protein
MPQAEVKPLAAAQGAGQDLQATLRAIQATGAGFAEALALAATVHPPDEVLRVLKGRLARFQKPQGWLRFLDALAVCAPDLARAGLDGRLRECLEYPNLDLSGRAWLATLPEGLKVMGDLHLNACFALSTLPDGLWVQGNFRLDGCVSLAALPQGIQVGGYLHLSGCSSLRSVGIGLTVKKGVFLDHCTALERLPDGMRVGASLNLEGCSSLTDLPADLVLEECLRLGPGDPLAQWSDEDLRQRCPGIRKGIYRT